MHNPIPASHSYFFIPAFVSSQAAMTPTLRARFISRNRAGRVGRAAAVIANSGRSMHRHSPSRTQSPLEVANQPAVHAFDVIVGHVIERLIGQIRSVGKQGIAYFFAHGGIVRGVRGKFHSLFPVVGFVHTESYAARHNKTSLSLR